MADDHKTSELSGTRGGARGAGFDIGLTIFGATGDLALRMLYPSLYHLHADGLAPNNLGIVGVARSQLSDAEFIGRVEAAVKERAKEDFKPEVFASFAQRLRYFGADVASPQMSERLAAHLEGARERVYYLSTSPSLFGAVVNDLSQAGLNQGDARVVVEKPLGRDLASCRQINDELGGAFSEERIFRIDHYLGKETVQNLIALRFGNVLFEPLWNKVSIARVDITVAETVGVEGRFGYYDEYGALRDMVQNHLMQLLCLVAMEPPASLDADSVRNEKVKVLRSLRRIGAGDVKAMTVRGQYAEGELGGKAVPAYVGEPGSHASDTETFVAIRAHIDNWRWAGTPFVLRTGKRLRERSSEIVIQFRDAPHSIFGASALEANRLVIKLQPEEEISLSLMNKTPTLESGGAMELKPLSLDLSLDAAFKGRRRIAYERLLLAALNNDPTLFVRRDEAEAAWSWIDGIEAGWRAMGQAPVLYAAGTVGPGNPPGD